MQKSSFILLSLLLYGVFGAAAQTKTVNGIIISSEDQQALVGVSIVLELGDKVTGTVSDIDGRFSLTVPTEAKTLKFSYIGMNTKELPISPEMKVLMEPLVIEQEEFVVLGYGSARKLSSVSGSVVRIDSRKIEGKATANVMESLQGQVAGLQVYTSSGEPSASSSIRLHGVGSLSASNEPLYVIDGVPVSASIFLSLNPNDFESITVLKDASSTAIYGSRSANGVIYVTTKRGERGERAKITLNAEYGYSKVFDKGTGFDLMSSQELLDFRIKNEKNKPSPNQEKIKTWEEYKKTGVNYNWFDYQFFDAPMYKFGVSAQGGAGRTNYYISLGHADENGITYGSGRKIYNFRVNLNSQLNDWLQVGNTVALAKNKTNRTPFKGFNTLGPIGALIRNPYFSPFDKDGKPYKDFIPGVNMYHQSYILSKNIENNRNHIINGSAYIQITPVEGLIIKSQYGLEANFFRNSSLSLPTYIPNKGVGEREEYISQNSSIILTNTAEYRFNLHNNHHINILVGQEGRKTKFDDVSAFAKGQTDDRLMLFNAASSDSKMMQKPTQSENETAFLSFFSKLNYDYSEKYFLDFSVRQDAASFFGKETREGVFYSIGFSWDLMKENFMPQGGALSGLRLKMNHGTTGNSGGIGSYEHLAQIGSRPYGSQSGWYLSRPGNTYLSWETQAKSVIGFASSFFNNRINIELDYYVRKTRNMLMTVPFPYTSGFNNARNNIGTIQNRGIDLMFSADIIRLKNWNLQFRKSFGYNQNKITELFHGLKQWTDQGTGVSYIVGKPVEFFYPIWKGVDPADGKQQWLDPKTGELTKNFSDDLAQATGMNRYAPINGGFSFSLSTKMGIEFSADFAYVIGKYIINNDRLLTENPAAVSEIFNQSRRVNSAWEKTGDKTKIPRYGEYFEFDTHLIENADFLRFKNLSIAYSFPESFLRSQHLIKGVKVYATARNLLTLTKYSGFDPEVDSNIALGNYPNTKQFLLGLQVTL